VYLGMLGKCREREGKEEKRGEEENRYKVSGSEERVRG